MPHPAKIKEGTQHLIMRRMWHQLRRVPETICIAISSRSLPANVPVGCTFLGDCLKGFIFSLKNLAWQPDPVFDMILARSYFAFLALVECAHPCECQAGRLHMPWSTSPRLLGWPVQLRLFLAFFSFGCHHEVCEGAAPSSCRLPAPRHSFSIGTEWQAMGHNGPNWR